MKYKINNKYFKWGLTAFLVIAAGVIFYYLVFHNADIIDNIKGIVGVVMPIVFGLIIAYLLTPVLNFIEGKALNPFLDLCRARRNKTRAKWVRAISVFITSLLLIIFIYILIAMLVSQIVPSVQNIVRNFDGYINNLSIWLNKLLEDNQELKSFVMPQVNRFSVELERWLDDTASLLAKSSVLLKTVSLSILSFIKTTWNFIIGFIISIYVLFSKETFAAQGKKLIYAVFDPDTGNHILRSIRFVHKTFIGFISGKILDSIIIGMLCFIGTSIMNTPYAVLISVIVGVTNVIPFFGPYLGAIPCALLLLMVDLTHPMTCISFVIFIIILQQVDGNIIGPRILGESTGLSGFWVIFAITVFGGLFGIPGMIIGVPIFAVIYALVKEMVNRSLNKKNMSICSEDYMNLEYFDETTGEIRKTSHTEQQKSSKQKNIKQKKLFHVKKLQPFKSNSNQENQSNKEEELQEINQASTQNNEIYDDNRVDQNDNN